MGGMPVEHNTMHHTSLPTALGGVGLSLPSEERAVAAFLATHQTHRARMPASSAALGREWSGVAQDEAADQAREALRVAGIQVRGGQAGPNGSCEPTTQCRAVGRMHASPGPLRAQTRVGA